MLKKIRCKIFNRHDWRIIEKTSLFAVKECMDCGKKKKSVGTDGHIIYETEVKKNG